MGPKTTLYVLGLRKIYDYIDKDPKANLPKLGEYMDKFLPADSDMMGRLSVVKSVLEDSDNN